MTSGAFVGSTAFWVNAGYDVRSVVDSSSYAAFRERIYAEARQMDAAARIADGRGGMDVIELAAESVRRKGFAHRPCRFRAVFLWPDIADALAWLPPRPGARLYEVRLDVVRTAFVGDQDLVTCFPVPFTLATAVPQLRRYWRGDVVVGPLELVLDGAVTILRDLT